MKFLTAIALSVAVFSGALAACSTNQSIDQQNIEQASLWNKASAATLKAEREAKEAAEREEFNRKMVMCVPIYDDENSFEPSSFVCDKDAPVLSVSNDIAGVVYDGIIE